MHQKCVLCHSQNTEKREITAKPPGTYWFCGNCEYIFRDRSELLNQQEEKIRYELHQNEDSVGYRRFLAPVVDSVERHIDIKEPQKALDFGCGPVPFLSRIFAEKGLEMAIYDPYFFCNESLLEFQYDLVTSTEVFEHFYEPRKELDLLKKLVKSGGHLVVMTAIPPALEIFKSWAYRREETHVGFFSRKSFQYIANEWGFKILESKDNVWVLQNQL